MTIINFAGGLANAGLVAPFEPMAVQNVFAVTADRLYGVRVVVPKGGTLHDVSIFVAGSQGGNMKVGVYDTGDAASGSRTKLWDSGTVAFQAGYGWQVAGDPALTVVSGQQLDLVVVDDAGQLIGQGFLGSYTNAEAQLPASFLPAAGGASPKLAWTFNWGAFSLPTSITEANCSVVSNAVALIARVA